MATPRIDGMRGQPWELRAVALEAGDESHADGGVRGWSWELGAAMLEADGEPRGEGARGWGVSELGGSGTRGRWRALLRAAPSSRPAEGDRGCKASWCCREFF